MFETDDPGVLEAIEVYCCVTELLPVCMDDFVEENVSVGPGSAVDVDT